MDVNVNITQTKDYYSAITASSLCDCAYCRNYRLLIRTAYPKVAAYLDSLGIDIEKPFETSPLEPDENGLMEYCGCQYIVLGSCETEYRHRIDEVELRIAASYPSTGIRQKHFVIEIFPIRLKYAS